MEHIKQLRDRVEISIVEDLRSRLKHSKQEEANVEARLGARWAKAEEGRDNSQRELHRKLDDDPKRLDRKPSRVIKMRRLRPDYRRT